MAVDRLSREQIVCAAIELLDADGVDGLSMRQLGSRLGSGATSVYWHVGNKDNLVALAADAVFGEVDLPDPAEIGWRDAIVASSHGLRNVILRHRWLIPVLGAHPTINGKHIASYQNHALTEPFSTCRSGSSGAWLCGCRRRASEPVTCAAVVRAVALQPSRSPDAEARWSG
ncbi:TetR family transcriptional regulator [Pseudonocardia sp. HH130629-09]|uniref:TetR family transcriptional regulator n=1 Tax=Pseudonocardia sp. HH130629-09 TaxID=1641402 RepID=UPI0007610F89|nr:TetR family transcriptional regulator [Pseudonocardia sp. HH130629-09]